MIEFPLQIRFDLNHVGENFLKLFPREPVGSLGRFHFEGIVWREFLDDVGAEGQTAVFVVTRSFHAPP